MASGTSRITLTPTPQRIDNLGGSANLFLTIKVLSGSAQFFYMAGTSAPAAADLDKGYPKHAMGTEDSNAELKVDMAASESLWASGSGQLAIMSRAA